MRYRFIDAHKKAWPINLMCGVLNVSRSGFYHWAGREPSRRAQSNQAMFGVAMFGVGVKTLAGSSGK
jgi:hypothetical protein